MAYWLLNDWGNKYLKHINDHRFTRIGKETSLSDAIPRTVHSIRWSLLRFGRCWTRTTGTQHHCPLPGKYLPVQARQLLAGCIAQNLRTSYDVLFVFCKVPKVPFPAIWLLASARWVSALAFLSSTANWRLDILPIYEIPVKKNVGSNIQACRTPQVTFLLLYPT